MWFLFACIFTGASSGTYCNAPIQVVNMDMCRAMAREYRKTAGESMPKKNVQLRCVKLDADGNSEEMPEYMR